MMFVAETSDLPSCNDEGEKKYWVFVRDANQYLVCPCGNEGHNTTRVSNMRRAFRSNHVRKVTREKPEVESEDLDSDEDGSKKRGPVSERDVLKTKGRDDLVLPVLRVNVLTHEFSREVQ